ncbi:MAG TPA: MBL fold metallo-hydrolase [Acidimicrobiales bacterium]|nr:MBL fold metallo-hydrolase [Acidimicrobiales bacterium]
MRVHFLGVRGSTPAPGPEFVRYGGHTSCVVLAHDGQRPSLILDAGTGIRRLPELLEGRAFSGSLLMTHLHWDHVHGLPFCSATDREDARTSLLIPDQGDGSDPLELLARGMSPPHFPVRPDELRGEWGFGALVPGEYELEGFGVRVHDVPHKGGRTFGFRVSDDSSSITYIPDHCPTALGDGPDGLGEYHPAALALCEDSEVLIHDAQLVADELAAEAYFGHAALEYAVALATRTGVPRVALFHHKPDRSDDDLDAIARRFESSRGVMVASQATVLEL